MRILRIHSALCLSAAGFLLAACGSSTEDTTDTSTAGTTGASGNGGTAQGGSSGTAQGGSSGTAQGGTAGTLTNGGSSGTVAGGAGGAAAGTGGTAQGGASGEGGAAAGAAGTAQGGAGGADNNCGEAPPAAPISSLITAPADRYTHNVDGRPAAVDLRAPTIMGKLIVDLGVSSGGIYNFGVDRGFHTYGGEIQVNGQQCSLTYVNSPSSANVHNGDCRLNTFDGMPHGDSSGDTPETSLSGRIKAALQELSTNAPGQGWEYFLDTNGEVRWSDVGFTGYSHGAQTAARIATAVCVWRAVSRSGPRDNECGNGQAPGNYDPVTQSWPSPPYDADCERASAWIFETPASPMSAFYSFAGKTDGQFGDFQYTLDQLGGGYLGEPVNISTTEPGDSHRFYADDGHGGFDSEEYWPALQKAWGVPDDNMAYGATL